MGTAILVTVVTSRTGQKVDFSISLSGFTSALVRAGEGGRNWARFASLIGTCKMNGIESYAYLCDLFTRLANGHLANDIDALMP